MTKATKNSLFGSKDDKRAQAQKRKQEQQAKAAAEARKNLKTSDPNSVDDGAEFNLLVDDWESRISGASSVHSKSADTLHGRNTSSSDPEHQPSPSSLNASLKVPVADEVYEMEDIVSLAKLQLKDIPMNNDSPILPRIEKAKGNIECRPGGTAVIELQSPVELDRLTEFPASTPRKSSERSLRNPFHRKEKTKIVTLTKLQLRDVSAISGNPIVPPIGKAKGDHGRRPDGTEVIELNSPVELDRLKEWPESPQPAERRKRSRFSRKEKTENVKVVVRNGV